MLLAMGSDLARASIIRMNTHRVTGRKPWVRRRILRICQDHASAVWQEENFLMANDQPWYLEKNTVKQRNVIHLLWELDVSLRNHLMSFPLVLIATSWSLFCSCWGRARVARHSAIKNIMNPQGRFLPWVVLVSRKWVKMRTRNVQHNQASC